MTDAITVEDLDNAKLDVNLIAEIANSTNETATDRLGHTKLTVVGAMNRLTAINFRGAWVTATAYAVKDAFSYAGQVYVAVVAHTSTTVAADLAAGKIGLYQGTATSNTDEFYDGADYTAGTTDALTLSRDPGSVENITVFFGSNYQGPNQIAGLSGTTLTFVDPIPPGITEVFVQIGRLQSTVQPSARSVGDDQLSWGTSLSRAVDTIAALRALNSSVYKRAFAMGYYDPLDDGGGTYYLDPSDTSSADNGGTVIVGTDGGRWKLKLTLGQVSVKQFGAKGIGAAFNDSPSIQACINAVDPAGEIYFPEASGYYNLLTTINLPAVSGEDSSLYLRGNGIGSVLRPGAAMATMFNCPGKNVRIEGLFLWNQSSYATSGITQSTDSLSAGLSGRYTKCYIIGFTNGMLCAGQNFTFEEMWMQDNTTHFKFTNDGRNTTWYEPYCLGGSTGFSFDKTTHQPEGVAIIGGKTLVTGGSGAGISLTCGLDITLLAHVIDQTGLGSPGIYMNIPGGNALAKVRIMGGWIAGGENSYAIFGSGNIAELYVGGNASIMSNNGLNLTAGISLNGTNGFKLENVNFGVVGGQDLSLVSVSNHARWGCASSQGSSSNAVGNYTDQGLIVDFLQIGGTGGAKIRHGTGNPNGVVSGNPTDWFMRSDGGVGGHAYICAGGTTWNAITGA